MCGNRYPVRDAPYAFLSAFPVSHHSPRARRDHAEALQVPASGHLPLHALHVLHAPHAAYVLSLASGSGYASYCMFCCLYDLSNF